MPPRKRKSDDSTVASAAKRQVTSRPHNEPEKGVVNKKCNVDGHPTKSEATSQVDGNVTSETSGSSTWKPPKTKRSDIERSIGYVGAIVPPEPKDAFDKSWERHEQVLRNGPNGPPVYDDLGYPLSYARLKKTTNNPRRYNARRHQAYLDEKMAQSKKIREIMGRPNEDNINAQTAWQDRVARDLDIPFHTVGVPEFEEWRRRGFKLEPGELEGQPSKQELHRLFKLMTGSAFREESIS